MKTLTPIFHDPEYERPHPGCEIQARWPDLVATARSSSLTSEIPVFYEFASLPGGFFLSGVGYRKARPEIQPDHSLREAILGRMIAGYGLSESIRGSIEECGCDSGDASIRYAVVDPSTARVELCGYGVHTSALHIANGITRPLGLPWKSGQAIPRHVTMYPGDALLLAAHPGTWNKFALCTVDQALDADGERLSEHEALHLCVRAQEATVGDSASVVLYRSGTDCP